MAQWLFYEAPSWLHAANCGGDPTGIPQNMLLYYRCVVLCYAASLINWYIFMKDIHTHGHEIHACPSTNTRRSIFVSMDFSQAVLKDILSSLRTLLHTMAAPLCIGTLVLVSLGLAQTPGSCHGTRLSSGTSPSLTTQSSWRLKEVRGL